MSVSPFSLHDAAGERIASLHDDMVHGLDGTVLGLHVRALGLVIDLDGAYLGEIVLTDRFLARMGVPANGSLRIQAQSTPRPVNVVPLRPETAALPGYGDVARSRLGLGAAMAAA